VSVGLINCPLCGNTSGKKITLDLYKCEKCFLIFNVNCKSLSYDRDYFISEYQRQYGRTYPEDFENIYNLSRLRLGKILKFFKGRVNLSLLDIGSAAGFFLRAGKDMGIEKVKGVEISGFAADYCRKNFSIDVIESSFETAEIYEKYDIITSWFFIEHLADPLKSMERIYSLLNEGGVFALAVPSCFGPMYIFKKDEWIKTRPVDHKIDLSPKAAKIILKNIGFRKVKVIRSGYHPERIVSRNSLLFRPFDLLYSVFTSITAFSDTIEIYAVK
jgi:SAM-dependent methyltransferase